jgi:hypothetical protein
MRSAIILAIGVALLGVCVFLPRLFGRPELGVAGAKIFIAIWLAAMLANMYLGVSRAGYSVAEELPIFLLLFAVPAAVAVFAWWKLST